MQQEMSEPSETVTEANTIVAITKTVLELMTKLPLRIAGSSNGIYIWRQRQERTMHVAVL